MDRTNYNCKTCAADLVCNKKDNMDSDFCVDFQKHLKNDQDKMILEFVSKNYHARGSVKDDPFIQAVIKLKEDRDQRMKSELYDVLGDFINKK